MSFSASFLASFALGAVVRILSYLKSAFAWAFKRAFL
jgi:hypothetical protein